ncbi:fused MFS/spermidine synthase [Catenulispora yoronensis]|uniref:Fused MFS/spermidine synthase n=1 Tax=Catenulispora yoronensis TaxID=450799 RepID=A0ABN2V0U4_9ACTN
MPRENTSHDETWDLFDGEAEQPELLRDLDRRNAFQLMLGGTPHSHVDLDDPTHLEYEYVRQIAFMVDLAAAERAPLRVLHLGGGGLTLPRYIAVTRPGSGQQVVEIDGKLLDFVRAELPLPRNARVRLRTGDARDVLGRVPEGAFDLTITDVYAGARIPKHLTSSEYYGLSKRALRPQGVHIANLADGAAGGGLAFTRGQVANARHHFAHVAVLTDPGILRGRKFGNLVLLASDGPLPLDGLVRRAASDIFPCRVMHGDDLAAFQGGAKPVPDGETQQSPEPPGDAF